MDGPTSLMVDVPSGTRSARLTNDAIRRVTNEESVGGLRVADVSDLTAGSTKFFEAFASLPLGDVAVNAAVLTVVAIHVNVDVNHAGGRNPRTDE